MPGRNWGVELADSAYKSLERLPTSDRQRILNRLASLEAHVNPFLHKDIRTLQGKLRPFYRFRVGEYRLIVEFDSSNRRIGVLAVASRGNAY